MGDKVEYWVEKLALLIEQDMADREHNLRDDGVDVVKALGVLRKRYADEVMTRMVNAMGR